VLARQSFEKLPHVAALAPLSLLDTSAYSSHSLEKLLVFNQLLISFSALNHNLSLSIDGQHRGSASLFELCDMVTRIALEIAQGVNVGQGHAHTINLRDIAC
jgi:hypothetical protein